MDPRVTMTRKRVPRRAERPDLRGTGPKRKQGRQAVPGLEWGGRKSGETWVKPGLALELRCTRRTQAHHGALN